MSDTQENRCLNRDLYFQSSAKLLRHLGKNDFYNEMVKFLANLIDCKRWLVIRYPRYAPPEFIVNNALTQEAINYYNDGLYQLDPLFHITRTSHIDDVLILSRLEEKDSYSAYLEKTMDSANIKDEIAILVNGPGQVNIVFTLDNSYENFSDNEVNLIRTALPFISEMHRHHLSLVFSQAIHAQTTMDNIGQQRAALLEDQEGNIVYKSPDWLDLENQEGKIELLKDKKITNEACGMITYQNKYLVHWETMSESFAVAPRGRMYTLDKVSNDYPSLSFSKMLVDFSKKHKITPREVEIINQVLKGYPNSLIAEKLKVSIGTVKNHRYRLYYKLDITTERELFSMFLDSLLNSDAKIYG
ncbi:MAG: helix-turn-helix transcriptional regulator [Oceanospirillaceae bacterium]